jgi:hypothetical protein
MPCRSRHIKCDGIRPCCGRCSETAQQCQYGTSRRGGLDRAALAERRRQRLVNAEAGAISMPPTQYVVRSPADPLLTNQVVDIAYHSIHDLQSDISPGSEASLSSSTAATHSPVDDVQADSLVNSYYRNFHIFHPFLLPQKHLVRLYQDPRRKFQFRPLIAFMRFIGNIYASSNWSTELKDYAEACLSQAQPTDPILVQCRLLYSIALFWNDNKTDAIHQMDNAIRLAIDLQMYQKDFPVKHGADDAILMECWRRTWWMLYIVDTYYAGTLGSMRTGLSDVEATVGLPCEEPDYESGVRTVYVTRLPRCLVCVGGVSRLCIMGADLTIENSRASNPTRL